MALLAAGKLVGRYLISHYLDSGGMQEVYCAIDQLFNRVVALKTPKNDAGERRFDRTAQNSALVNQADVARTLDYFEFEGRRFLIEELVPGIDLGKLLKRIPQLDPYAAARILHALARGIAAVHTESIVHRDLKPSNIMVSGGFALSEIKVTDFGVSKMAKAEIDAGLAGDLLLTGSKTLIGHLPYLAPEILRKRSTVDMRADIWAIGALAFHLIAGEPPFGHELADAVIRILSAPMPAVPDSVDSNPQFRDLGRELYGIAAACLQRDSASRPTAQQLVGMCERLCYPVLEREIAIVTGYPGRTFGFAQSKCGDVFFHSASVFGDTMPSVGSEIWFVRHPGKPHDRAHPVVPILSDGSPGNTP